MDRLLLISWNPLPWTFNGVQTSRLAGGKIPFATVQLQPDISPPDLGFALLLAALGGSTLLPEVGTPGPYSLSAEGLP
jgi:hypothetical protein